MLILHGLLHLAGFDHEHDKGEMARRERVLRGRLGLPEGLIERSGDPTFAPDHPTDEDLSVVTPGRREDGARRGLFRGRTADPSTPVAVATSAQDDKLSKRRVIRSAQDDKVKELRRRGA